MLLAKKESTQRVIIGDCLLHMAEMEPGSIHAIITDPPYNLTASKRTVPAPHISGSPYGRHRVGVNGDTAPVGGFMVNEWDGTGISFNVDTWRAALRVLKPGGYLLAFGGTRTFHRIACAVEDAGFEIRDCLSWLYGQGFPKSLNLDGELEGWGTALKPAWEPIIVARKPLIGTVVANVTAHKTGALNIDGCRIQREESDRFEYGRNPILPPISSVSLGGFSEISPYHPHDRGRWPANVVLDEDAAATLDAQVGVKGGASRFFYTPKATKNERGDGNNHPTVKPIALMRWLIRMVTPPGGVILDPFAGSGTTLLAADDEGFSGIGIELSEEYVSIARSRLLTRASSRPEDV